MVTPAPSRPKAPVPTDAPATMWEIQTGVLSGAPAPEAADDPTAGTVRLPQASLSDVLANVRQQRRSELTADPYLVWVIAFQALGLVTALGAIVLLVFVLLA
jgi:hypothetical protein